MAFLLLEPHAGKWAKVCGPAGSAIILLLWMVAFGSVVGIERVLTRLAVVLFYPQLVFECVCGWLAGVRVADMFAAGRAWNSFRQQVIGWRLIPEHPDGAGGFKPIGDFFFYQCLIAGISTVYLAAWGFLIPLFRAFRYYTLWFGPYLFLLAVFIAIEIIVFVLSMWSVHVIMRQEKAKLPARADGFSIRIDSKQRQVGASPRSVANYQQIKTPLRG